VEIVRTRGGQGLGSYLRATLYGGPLDWQSTVPRGCDLKQAPECRPLTREPPRCRQTMPPASPPRGDHEAKDGGVRNPKKGRNLRAISGEIGRKLGSVSTPKFTGAAGLKSATVEALGG
jgi:hypothetical protein